MQYVKGTIEICVFCEYVLTQMIYAGVEEYIRVPIKGLDDLGKALKTPIDIKSTFAQVYSSNCRTSSTLQDQAMHCAQIIIKRKMQVI